MKTIKEYNSLYKWNIPTNCECCGTELIINESGFPECINNNCARKTSHRFTKMFDVLGIKGAGEAFVSNLEKNNISVLDFLEMCKVNDSKSLCKFAGGINGNKILKQMKDVMNSPISIPKFLATFDYNGFDEKKISLLDFSLEEMYNLTISDIVKIDGFAEITANLFIEFMRDKREEIELVRNYFNIVKQEKKEEKTEGLKICFTGTAPISRKELTELLLSKGYNVKDSITKDLDILLCEDPNGSSSKLVKARKNGIKIISYSEFLN